MILWQDLKFYSYKIKGGPGTENVAQQKRVNFAVCMQELFNCNPSAILLMSDEAHFHLNGSVNKQNFCYWAP